MRKILVITPFLPFPLDAGGNMGTFHMLNLIKDHYDVHLWFHIKGSDSEFKRIRNLDEALKNKVHIHYTKNTVGRNYVTFRALRRKFESFFLKNDKQYLHNKRIWGEGQNGLADLQVLEDIEKIINDNNIDIVQVEYSFIMDIVYALPDNVKKIFIHHELRFAKQETLMNQISERLAYDRYQYKKCLSEEIQILNQYDCVVTMSDVDKEKLQTIGVKTKVESSPSFIPTPQIPTFRDSSNRLSYVACGGHYPNEEGLLWFLEKVHPLLIKEVDYKLDICGTQWNVEKFNVKNFAFHGFVENLNDIVPGSIMIIPILSGSGMRMKILEAVNNAVPFVSTSVGAEGMNFENGKDCFIEDNPSSFAQRILELLKDSTLQAKMVSNSRATYDQFYSPGVQANKRLHILEKL